MPVLSETLPWLSENNYRAYPFMGAADRIADSGYMLDFNVILDGQIYLTTYPIETNVCLTQIIVNGNEVTFTFTEDNVFTITDRTVVGDYFYFPRLSNGSFFTLGSQIINIPQGTHNFASLNLEPAVCYQIGGAWQGVTSISTNPEYTTSTGQVPSYTPTLPLVPVESSTILTGDINLYEGFNFDISFSGNSIILEVDSGFGIPLSCSTQFLSSDTDDCDDIISYVNGVAPNSDGNLQLIAGTNIVLVDGQIQADFIDYIDTEADYTYPANPHTLFVGFSFQTTDLCSPLVTYPNTN